MAAKAAGTLRYGFSGLDYVETLRYPLYCLKPPKIERVNLRFMKFPNFDLEGRPGGTAFLFCGIGCIEVFFVNHAPI
jgi:hypothetical protein